MLPTYRRLDGSLVTPSGTSVVCRTSIAKLSRVAVGLIFGAFIYSIVWSILYNFEAATHTHCEVRNYLPSVSSAIGNHEPQRTIWTLCIIIHFPMRLIIVQMYFRLYRDHIRPIYQWCVGIVIALSFLENFALLFLSIWTSTRNYEVHKRSFSVFVSCAELYMISTYFLNKHARILPMNSIERRSLDYKRRITIVNLVSLILASYFFYRHNTKCEPGVYSLFSFFEYLIVLSNMAYHSTAYLDFHGRCIQYEWWHGLRLSHM